MKLTYLLDIFPKLSETFILNEILEVQKRGLEVDIYAHARAKEELVHPHVKDVKNVHYPEKVTAAGILSDHLWFLFRHPLRYLRALRAVCDPRNGLGRFFMTRLGQVRKIARSGSTHIHAHFALTATDLALLVHLLTGIPFTFTSHHYDIFMTPPKNFKLKTAMSKKHVTISEFNRRYIVDTSGADEKRIAVVHCGVDFTRVFPASQDTGENLIVSIARLEPIKGLDVLIRACALLKKRKVSFRCLIVGEGPEHGALEKLARDMGLSAEVEFLGNLIQKEVFDLLSKASIMALPSRSEGVPVSLMEAMAMKVPVVATNVHGVPELVRDGENGFLVPSEDVDALAEKMKILLEDDGLRAKFKEEGYRTVRGKFDLQNEVGKLIGIWAER